MYNVADNPTVKAVRVMAKGFRVREHGFTMPEVLVTIAIMGIVFAIASSTWLGLTESRRVTSATNQLTGDLRLAHTRATNRLDTYEVLFTGGRSYEIGPSGATEPRELPEGTQIASGPVTGVRFTGNGEANPIPALSGSSITVSSDDGAPSTVIEFNSQTSRIKIDP